FGEDTALASWFGQQINDDVAMLEASQHHARQMREILSRMPQTGVQRSPHRQHTAQDATAVTGSAAARSGEPALPDEDLRRNVFVIYGRDEQVRECMFAFMRALDLRPLEWERLVGATGSTSPYLGEVVQLAPAQGQATVVLMTPDDVVHLHPDLHSKR